MIELAGISQDELDALAQLTPEQKAFIKALVNQGEKTVSYSNDIEKLAKLSKIAYDYAEENNWTETKTSIKSAKEQLLTIDELWHKRERQFRPLDV